MHVDRIFHLDFKPRFHDCFIVKRRFTYEKKRCVVSEELLKNKTDFTAMLPIDVILMICEHLSVPTIFHLLSVNKQLRRGLY